MRRRSLGFAAFGPLVAGLLAAGGAGAQQPLPVPEAWDTAYVVLLEANPDYRPTSDEAHQAALQGHFQYQLRLLADGRTIRGGPLVAEPGAALVGITVLRAASLDEARTIAADDPGVRAGLFRATVRVWTTPRVQQPARSRGPVEFGVRRLLARDASPDPDPRNTAADEP